MSTRRSETGCPGKMCADRRSQWYRRGCLIAVVFVAALNKVATAGGASEAAAEDAVRNIGLEEGAIRHEEPEEGAIRHEELE